MELSDAGWRISSTNLWGTAMVSLLHPHRDPQLWTYVLYRYTGVYLVYELPCSGKR